MLPFVEPARRRPLAWRTRSARRAGASRRRGKILAIKWGLNPNSSSLGVDVTFLLVGATVLAMVTPMIGALLRGRRAAAPSSAELDER